jgi:hypothetical protein
MLIMKCNVATKIPEVLQWRESEFVAQCVKEVDFLPWLSESRGAEPRAVS